jgi:hypothetical protein
VIHAQRAASLLSMYNGGASRRAVARFPLLFPSHRRRREHATQSFEYS